MNAPNRLRNFFLSLTGQDKISKKEMRRYFTNDPLIVEAGAHSGVDTIELAKIFPNSKIFAFEPVPEVFSKLRERTLEFPQISCIESALGTTTGKSEIFVSSGASDGSSSLLKPKEHLKTHPDVTFEKRIEIRTVNLDEWVKQEHIEAPEFLWLDMQGFELSVLKSSPKTVESVKLIYTEVSLIENYEGAPLYAEFKEWLYKESFVVVKEALSWKDGGNVLFAKAGLSPQYD